jgi:ADP-ribose pyrophosphatase YjhB (NUDIX family)
MEEFKWLIIAKELQSIAQAGLTFCENKYDIERYQQIRALSVKIMHAYSDAPLNKITELFATEKGYQTPKVDVRGVVFRNGKILMVRETIDGFWTLPGGWADVNLSPFENVAKEVFEEAGLKIRPTRLLAVYDKSKDSEHPADIYHIYKMFIYCEDSGADINTGIETSDACWFDRHSIPPLSLPRITHTQIEKMFEFHDNPMLITICD